MAVERHGRWGRAIEVPGLGALNKGDAHVYSVSCASAGSCTAGGSYEDQHFSTLGFVAAGRNGRWGKATGVPGLGALNAGGNASVFSLSCASAGNCAAGGYYDTRSSVQGFVVEADSITASSNAHRSRRTPSAENCSKRLPPKSRDSSRCT